MGTGRRVAVHLESVELARGYDGPLRGAPEPCLLFGAFLVRAGKVLPLGRALERLLVGSRFPTRVEPDKTLLHLRTHAASQGEDQGAFVLLAIALEEDSGKGIASLYATLEQPSRIWLWRTEAEVPEPRPLEEVAQLISSSAPTADQVGVLQDGVPLDQVRSDDWVDALLARVPLDRYGLREYRFRFVSPDERNDWAATILIRVH